MTMVVDLVTDAPSFVILESISNLIRELLKSIEVDDIYKNFPS